MELRSSRSRSRTPFKTGYEEDEASSANVITRVTRSTTYKSFDSTYSGEEVSQSSQKTVKHNSGKTAKYGKYKTSDYSSEEGDNEVTSTDIEQNSKNSRIEQSQHRNGSGLSALKIYRDAREYWNRYPKTDYTYSRHSKDRVEIAPGVINMPNMSRKSIHGICDMDVCNKETNTETERMITRRVEQNKLRPRALFQRNNNSHEEYEFHQQTHRSVSRTTVISRVYTLITSIVSVFFGLLYRLTEKQNVWFHSIGSFLHKITSKVMRFDTWLLMGHEKFNKTNALLGLCLIPLLLLGGLWWVAPLGQIAGLMSNYTEALFVPPKPPTKVEIAAANLPPQVIEKVVRIQLDNPQRPGFTGDQLEAIAGSLKSTLNLDLSTETIVKIMLGDPNVQEIELLYPQLHAKLEQPPTSTNYDIDKIIEGVINSPNLKAAFQTKNDNSKSELEVMKLEIEQLKTNLASMLLQQKTDTILLNREIKTCCRRSFLQMERYVSNILAGLLDKPAHKEDTLRWLSSVFVAKEDLELRINKATGNLKSEYDALIENNAKKLMDEVTVRIRNEIDTKFKYSVHGEYTMPSDDYIRGIVKGVLAIYDADKTGMVDYALESAGGQIISTRCTESFKLNTAVVSILGIPIWYPSHSPRVVISPGIVPGECWAFQNFPGYLLIRLSSNISIEAFSYEHINRKLTPSGKVDSAPRNFSMHGFMNEKDYEPALLGEYVYDNEGDPLQFFPVQRNNSTFDLIELRVHSNHGNPQFTCLYRFRVHGKVNLTPT